MDAGRKRELEAKVYEGVRLTSADGEALYASDDLAWLGRLAHHRRTEAHGDRVTFHFEADPEATGMRAVVSGHSVDDVVRLREVQDETGGFEVFVPTTATNAPADALKTYAVTRLLFDNVPHVQADWGTHGLSVAQLLLNFGADDLTGAQVDDTTREDLLDLIRDAGFQPVERDARFAVIREYDRPIPLAERRSEPQQVWA